MRTGNDAFRLDALEPQVLLSATDPSAGVASFEPSPHRPSTPECAEDLFPVAPCGRELPPKTKETKELEGTMEWLPLFCSFRFFRLNQTLEVGPCGLPPKATGK